MSPITPADLRGLAQLGVDATVGITGIVEQVHQTIAHRQGLIGGIVYGAVRGIARGVGWGLDKTLGIAFQPGTDTSPEREAWLAALNGVWGDHLEATANPLAIPMQMRRHGSNATPHVVVLVHGLAMNDLQWQRSGHDHGEALAAALGCTPVWLHYNSGRHISHNGRDFAAQLQALVDGWPVPVQRLAIVGHSMGGLVARSACHHGEGQPWRNQLDALVCLGTPHHGAPLERGGRLVDALFGISRYGAPFARLGQARSAGITDLRYGNLLDADWQQHATRHVQHRDDRTPVPLPAGVKVAVVAGAADRLVPKASALGQHRNPAFDLGLPAAQQLLVPGAGHFDLLDRPEVFEALRGWLA